MDFRPICANWTPESTTCKKVGSSACKNCQLITYCGPECQRLHWSIHKPDCKSFLGKDIWKPDWVLEGRTPAFVGNGPPQVPFGSRKYLWGNVPAYDVLQLGANEGEAYSGSSQVLFAASGDLRNVITTIAQLPNKYNHAVEVTINDHDLDVVARNVIMLLVALVVDNVDEAADCIIHIWYSALIRKSDIDIIDKQVRPMIEAVCLKTANKAGSDLLAKSWTFGQRSMRLVLQKRAWDALMRFVDCRNGLAADEAHTIRKAVTLANDRKDYRDRNLSFQRNFHRVALTRFREDGLLLPFGTPRADFTYPNPTFFHGTKTWPMPDSADPLSGWSSKAVHETPNGPAKADIYGKLFVHLRTLLRAFLHRLSCRQQFLFRMYHVDAFTLRDYLKAGSYNRIEVSNIADAGYLGIHRTLDCMIPLLQSPVANSHATLITLFMNAVDETKNLDADGGLRLSSQDLEMKRVLEYLSVSPTSLTPTSPLIFKVLSARDGVADHDNTFNQYAAKFGFANAGELAGAAMKKEHTVVEKWPFKLKLRPGQPGAQDEFDRLICGGVSSKERYVEWKRV